MLEVSEVWKRYSPPPTWLRPVMRVASKAPFTALRDISFTVAAGEVVGLVGPNGAGKTTLLKMISTLLVPTIGRITVDGHDTVTDQRAACRRLGLVLEGDRGIFDRLSGRENLEFFGVMTGLDRHHAAVRADELLALMELAHRDKLTFGYSAGMRMRLSIARALMAEPALVVLDEPTRSLDSLGSRFVCRLVREVAAQGRSVLLSNHRLDEVVETCSRVVVIVGGRQRYSGPPSELPGATGREAAALADFIEAQAAGSGTDGSGTDGSGTDGSGADGSGAGG